MNKNKSSKSQESWLQVGEERTNVAAKKPQPFKTSARIIVPREDQERDRKGVCVWGGGGYTHRRLPALDSPHLLASLRSLWLPSA